MGIKYEIWPPRPTGGQICGSGSNGIKGVHYYDGDPEIPSGIEAICNFERSQHKNRLVVQEMIEWALASVKLA